MCASERAQDTDAGEPRLVVRLVSGLFGKTNGIPKGKQRTGLMNRVVNGDPEVEPKRPNYKIV